MSGSSDLSMVDHEGVDSGSSNPSTSSAVPNTVPPGPGDLPAQGTWPEPISILVSTIQELANNQTQLQAFIHNIGQFQANQAEVAAAAVAAQATVPPAPRGTLRVREPRVFDGRAIEVMPFLDELKSAMHLQRQHFQSDYDRSIYLSLYLKAPGAPSSWFRAIQIQQPDLLNNFDALLANFKKHFDDPDLKASKQRELEKLVQKKSVADFSARFREILVYLNMTEETKIHYFKAGLKEDLLTVLMAANDVPNTFDAFVDLAIKVDNRLFQTKAELAKRHGRTVTSSPFALNVPEQSTYAQTVSAPPVSSASESTGVVPMEIDAVKRGPLTDQERKRRRQLGLCNYCGASGHVVLNCPIRPNKKGSTQTAASTSSSSSKKGKGKPGSR